MQIYITQGIHPQVPGEPMTAHATIGGAVVKACELVKLIAADTPGAGHLNITSHTWEEARDWLEDYHGAANATVWITQLELED